MSPTPIRNSIEEPRLTAMYCRPALTLSRPEPCSSRPYDPASRTSKNTYRLKRSPVRNAPLRPMTNSRKRLWKRGLTIAHPDTAKVKEARASRLVTMSMSAASRSTTSTIPNGAAQSARRYTMTPSTSPLTVLSITNEMSTSVAVVAAPNPALKIPLRSSSRSMIAPTTSGRTMGNTARCGVRSTSWLAMGPPSCGGARSRSTLGGLLTVYVIGAGKAAGGQQHDQVESRHREADHDGREHESLRHRVRVLPGVDVHYGLQHRRGPQRKAAHRQQERVDRVREERQAKDHLERPRPQHQPNAGARDDADADGRDQLHHG